MTPLRLRRRVSAALSGRPLPADLQYGGSQLGGPPLGSDPSQYLKVRWMGSMGFVLEHGGCMLALGLSGMDRVDRLDFLVAPGTTAKQRGALCARSGASVVETGQAGPFNIQAPAPHTAGTNMIVGVGGLRVLMLGDEEPAEPKSADAVDLLLLDLSLPVANRLASSHQARLLIAGGWNDLGQPLEEAPRQRRGINARRFAQALARESSGTELAFLRPLSTLSIRAPEPAGGKREWSWEDALASLKPEDTAPPNLKMRRKKKS